jgi:hypothetical protein
MTAPRHSLVTAFGVVDVQVNASDRLHLSAGHIRSSSKAGLRINGVWYNLTLDLVRKPGEGWTVDETGWVWRYGLRRQRATATGDDHASEAAIEKAKQILEDVARWADRYSGVIGAARIRGMELALRHAEENVRRLRRELRAAEIEHFEVRAEMGLGPAPVSEEE